MTASIEDLYLHAVLGMPVSSRHGFAFIVTQANRAADANRTSAWFCDGEQSPIKLTNDELGATSPRLHPERRTLAFIRSADGCPSLYLVELDGGEARMLAKPGDGVTSIQHWSAERGSLLVCAERRDRLDGAPAIIDFLPYKMDGQGLTAGTRIALVEVDDSSGDCNWLVDAGGDIREARWSPDGQRLAWLQDGEGKQRHRAELWVKDADRMPRRIADELASMRDITWSRDGQRIFVAGSMAEGASQAFLHVIEIQTGEHLQLGDVEAAVPSCIHCFEDDAVLLLDAWRGRQRVVRVSTRNGESSVVHAPERGHVMSFGAGPQGLACVVADPTSGPELLLTNADGGDARDAGDFNAWRRDRRATKVEERTFTVPDGLGGSEEVSGWLLRPDGEGPFPLLLDMHGGPHSHVTFGFETHIHWPVLVERGWAILVLNTVGSDTFGQPFAERLRGHWGEYDWPQYRAATDALRIEGLVEEVAVLGHSYGGFLAAWALTQDMPLLVGIISAGVLDQYSHTGTSDTGYYVGPYAMLGELHEVPETYERLSPVRRARDISAPVLLLQGMEDLRCPVGQAEQMHTSLVRNGSGESRLVLFPGGSHHVSSTGRPTHRETWYGQLVDWLESHRGKVSR